MKNFRVPDEWEPEVTDAGPTFFTSWPGLLRKSDRVAEPGIRLVKHTIVGFLSVEAIEYRDEGGLLRGVAVWEPRGTLSVTVDPAFLRQGIGTRLLREAVELWPVDFESQSYSKDGAALVRKLLESERVRRASA